MPPDNYAIYNTAFASAVITAKMLGKTTFVFKGKRYKVANHIAGVVSDLDRGKYKVVCRKPRGTHRV